MHPAWFDGGITFSGTMLWPQDSRADSLGARVEMCLFACLFLLLSFEQDPILYLVATSVLGHRKKMRMNAVKSTGGSFSMTKGCGSISSEDAEVWL